MAMTPNSGDLGETARTSQTSPVRAVTVDAGGAVMPEAANPATSASTCFGTVTAGAPPLEAAASRALGNSTTLRCMTVAR